MAQYIDKSALVAKIERRIKINKECMLGLRNLDYYQGKVDALNDIISFIDTLEVREVGVDFGDPKGDKSAKCIIDTKNIEVKEVDFDAEWERYFEHRGEMATVNVKHLVKYFFELGIKVARKEE